MSRTSLSCLRVKERCRRGDSALDHILDGDTGHVPGELAGFDLCQIEHVVDELGEALAFTDDDIEVLDDLALGLLHFAVVLRNHREQALFKAAANDLRETENRGERRAQLVAHRGEERALSGIGLFRGRSRVACFFKQLRVVEGDAYGSGNCGEKALIGLGEAAFAARQTAR